MKRCLGILFTAFALLSLARLSGYLPERTLAWFGHGGMPPEPGTRRPVDPNPERRPVVPEPGPRRPEDVPVAPNDPVRGAALPYERTALETSKENRAKLVEILRRQYPEKTNEQLNLIAEQQLENVSAAWTNPHNFESIFKDGTIAHAVHQLLLAELAKEPANAARLKAWREAFESYRLRTPDERIAFLKALGEPSMEHYFRKLFNWAPDKAVHECWYRILKEYHDAASDVERQAVVKRYDVPLLREVYEKAHQAAVEVKAPLYRSVVPEIAFDPARPPSVPEMKSAVQAKVESARETGGMVSTSLDPMEAVAFRFNYWDRYGAPQPGAGKQRILTVVRYEPSAQNRGVVTTGGVAGDGHSPQTHDEYARTEVLRTGGDTHVRQVIQSDVGTVVPALLSRDRPLPQKFIEQSQRYRDLPMVVIIVGR